jgi:serine phosphatase RsbU (regulator of sigma subunit)
LLLARSVARARETAVRVALGAGLSRLAFHYLLEGLAVALPGAAGGLLFSFALLRILVGYAASASTRAQSVAADWRVLLFTCAAALFAGALTSVAPLWQATRTMPNDVLSEGVRASAGARSRRLAQSLVIAEIALAFVLLAVSAVLVAELRRLTRVSPGFDTGNLLTFQLTFTPESVPGKPGRVGYQDRLLQVLQAIPGVSGAAFANQLPLKGCCLSTAIFPEDPSARPSTGERVVYLPVSVDYFRTMRIPLLRGRLLNEHDNSETLLAAIVNQAAVRRYWPDRDPVQAYAHFNNPKGDRFQIIGVVGDVKNNGFDNPTVPEVYLSAAVVPASPLNFVVRSFLPEKTLIPEVRRAIQRVNPGQPIYDVKMMSQIAFESVLLKRLASWVMTFFALAALLMASLGAYGVVAYAVRQRTVEIGTRMALGAGSRDVLALVVGSGIKLAAFGAAIGAVVSFPLARLALSQFRITNPGVLPFVLSAAIISADAFAASFFPAWSATLLSPMVAIRNQPASMWESARRQLFEGLFRAGADTRDIALPPEANLMAEFVEASRRAGSFREAIRAALESLRANAGAQSAVLLENVSEGEFRATTSVPGDAASGCAIPRDGLLATRLRSRSTPLPLSAADLDAWRRWAEEFKPQRLPEIEALRETGARLAVALRTNKEVLGVLLLGESAAGQFTDFQKHLLRDCANHFALMLENARLTSRIVEHERLQRDLALAAEVQKRLLPRQSLDTPIAALAAVSIPARSVGGDYYDFLDLPGHRTAIALADVAGKGVAAALIMSVVQASLRVIASEPDISLPELAARMNHFLYRSTGTNSYATFFYAQLDEPRRALRYVNAGHNPPYLLRADAASLTVEELATGGTIIGMFPQARYEEGAIDLCPGDVLAIFTDGVPEAQNPAEEEFGEERLKTLLAGLLHLPVEEISSQISRELKNWVQDAPQYDDLTFVLMKVK